MQSVRPSQWNWPFHKLPLEVRVLVYFKHKPMYLLPLHLGIIQLTVSSSNRLFKMKNARKG